jgi:hypothetical protein
VHIVKWKIINILLVPNSLWLVPTIRIKMINHLADGLQIWQEIMTHGKILYITIFRIYSLWSAWTIWHDLYSYPRLELLYWSKSIWSAIWLRHKPKWQNIKCQYSTFQEIVDNVIKAKEMHIRLKNIPESKKYNIFIF